MLAAVNHSVCLLANKLTVKTNKRGRNIPTSPIFIHALKVLGGVGDFFKSFPKNRSYNDVIHWAKSMTIGNVAVERIEVIPTDWDA